MEHATTTCAAHGHPEITVRLRKPVPVPGLERLLIDYFQDAVAQGSRFLAGQTVQLGWATLRLIERAGGGLGVLEADLDAETGWVEAVDRALMATWLQKEVARSVGLDDRLEFPRHVHAVAVCTELLAVNAWTLARTAPTAETDSGWRFLCAGADHDHAGAGSVTTAQLIAVAWRLPFVTQFLALPPGATVRVTGPGRIRATVFLDERELTPRSGSYLAALAASGVKA